MVKTTWQGVYLVSLMLSLFYVSGCGIFREIPEFEEDICVENERVKDNLCTVCAPGSTNEAGDGTDGDDTQCDITECAADERVEANRCVSCPVGTSNMPGDLATGADTQCDANLCKANERVLDNSCVSCPEGEVNAAGDPASGPDTVCDGTLCRQNQRVASNMCVACPAGSTNVAGDDATGQDTACDPVLCEADQKVVANRCVSCEAGSVNAVGDPATGVDTNCDPILCEQNQRVRNNECVACPTGATRPPGDDASGADTQCDSTKCNINQRVQGGQCVACEAGQMNEAGDDASGGDTQCDAVTFTSVSASVDHTCALTSVGGVMCWGLNENGQLGDGAKVSRLSPVNVKGLRRPMVQIDCTDSSDLLGFCCGVDDVGEVACWGNNAFVRGGSFADTVLEATYLEGVERASEVATGNSHVCVLSTDKNISCLGSNISKQLGDESAAATRLPVDVQGLDEAYKVAVGGDFSCAMTRKGFSTGVLKCWGTNAYEVLARSGLEILASATPLTPDPLFNLPVGISHVAVGPEHVCANFFNDEIWCWGHGSSGKIGNGSAAGSPNGISGEPPTKVSYSFNDVAQLALGTNASCALDGDRVFCWGAIGTQQSLVPVEVQSFRLNPKYISVGKDHACAVLISGDIACWGSNSRGQLGDGTTTSSTTPVEIKFN